MMTFNYEMVISDYYDAFEGNNTVLILCLFIGKQEKILDRDEQRKALEDVIQISRNVSRFIGYG